MSSRIIYIATLVLVVSHSISHGDVRTYSVPKETYVTQEDLRRQKMEEARAKEISWRAPSHWTKKDAGNFRYASFEIKNGRSTLDLSISKLEGRSGTIRSNINRWRNQQGLKPLTRRQLRKFVMKRRINNEMFHIVDIYKRRGKKRTLAAIVVPDGNTKWFFKLSGSRKAVGREKKVFLDFLESVRLPDA